MQEFFLAASAFNIGNKFYVLKSARSLLQSSKQKTPAFDRCPLLARPSEQRSYLCGIDKRNSLTKTNAVSILADRHGTWGTA